MVYSDLEKSFEIIDFITIFVTDIVYYLLDLWMKKRKSDDVNSSVTSICIIFRNVNDCHKAVPP